MDEKTEELRDIFIEATGSETATERQTAGRGSLVDSSEVTDEQLTELIAEMRERFTFRTDLADDALVTVLRGVFAGASDADLAAELDTTAEEVFEARMDLHLVAEGDHTPVDTQVRRLVVAGMDVDACLERVDADAATVRRAYRVAESEVDAVRTNHRFRDEFADLLTEDGLSTRLASDARRDGLREAIEDLEVDTSL